MFRTPQHPGLNPAPEQQGGNPYYKPNVGLQQVTQRQNGEVDRALAEAHQAGAQAGKQQAEAQILRYGAKQLAGEHMQAQQQQAQQQVEQVAMGLLRGEIDVNTLGELVQAGKIPGNIAEAAVALAQQQGQQGQAPQQMAQQSQQQGLGSI